MHKVKCDEDVEHILLQSSFHDEVVYSHSISRIVVFLTLKLFCIRGSTRHRFSIVHVCERVVYATLCCFTPVGSNASTSIVKPWDQ